jgi:hypothetical protein
MSVFLVYSCMYVAVGLVISYVSCALTGNKVVHLFVDEVNNPILKISPKSTHIINYCIQE